MISSIKEGKKKVRKKNGQKKLEKMEKIKKKKKKKISPLLTAFKFFAWLLLYSKPNNSFNLFQVQLLTLLF